VHRFVKARKEKKWFSKVVVDNAANADRVALAQIVWAYAFDGQDSILIPRYLDPDLFRGFVALGVQCHRKVVALDHTFERIIPTIKQVGPVKQKLCQTLFDDRSIDKHCLFA
jgi:hypothetical protein